MKNYQPVIGLEIHVELRTKTKMFCSSLNDPDQRRPNVNVCPVCMGHPGTLPVINKAAVKKVIKTGLALGCQIPEHSKFDRKNYFYPDLPKGYQISQYDMPLCLGGHLEIDGKKIRIRRVHLEEDTARLIHPHTKRGQSTFGTKNNEVGPRYGVGVHPEGEDCSLVDFNRAGIPLMELVTEPDLSSAKEAKTFAEELHLILHYLDVSDADMEKGQMRVEVNLSLTKNLKELGTKVEIKNLNSFRSVERGIDYEIKRQTELLERGEKISQETRGWDDKKEITVSQREKEEAHDYRYFPEPDLPSLYHLKELIDEIRAEIPELPRQRKERLAEEYQLDENSIEMLVYNKNLGEYFEKTVSEFEPNLAKENLLKLTKLTVNYAISDLQGLLRGSSVVDKNFLITPENFAEFIGLIYKGKISSKTAKMILKEMFQTGADPSHIIKEGGLIQITDESEIEEIVKEVVSKNKKAVEDFQKGKTAVLQYLVGQIMAQSKGKANPQIVEKILRRHLSELK